MAKLLMDVLNNISFIAVCAVVAVMLAVTAKAAEDDLGTMHSVSVARRVSIIGICSALATVLHMLDFSLLFLAPGFYKVDFSELPVLLAGFFLGPSATVTCEGIKIVLKLLLKGTSTAFVGDFANYFVGCCFVLPATIIYHTGKKRSKAIIGLAVGTISMAVLGSAFNAIYLLPKFSELFGMPMNVIIGSGASIHPAVNSVTSFVFWCVAPLNVVKGTVVSILTMLLYKHVARPLFGAAGAPKKA